jgi:hypothetical protein
VEAVDVSIQLCLLAMRAKPDAAMLAWQSQHLQNSSCSARQGVLNHLQGAFQPALVYQHLAQGTTTT